MRSLAIWASGAGEPNRRVPTMVATMLYHLGRLVTYSIAGLIAGGIGSIVDLSGNLLGIQLAAARIAGSIMIVLGAAKLLSLYRGPKTTELRPSRIGKMLAKLRPFIHGLPPLGRALTVGMLTTLLPCGWLYLFTVIAAGTGSILFGPVVMAAFWVGTVPAITGLVAGTAALSRKATRSVPAIAAIVLIFAGCYTASGRGFANLRSLADTRIADIQVVDGSATLHHGSHVDGASDQSVFQQIHEVTQTPLPCCVDHDGGGEQP